MGVRVPLEESWLFEGLPSAVLAKIGALAAQRQYQAGAEVFSEGDLARELFILCDGEVELTCVLPSRTAVTMRIAHIKPGEVFGWSAIALGEKMTADARAILDSTAFLIPADRLLQILDEEPIAGYRVMARLSQIIAKRLRDTRTELRWIQSAI